MSNNGEHDGFDAVTLEVAFPVQPIVAAIPAKFIHDAWVDSLYNGDKEAVDRKPSDYELYKFAKQDLTWADIREYTDDNWPEIVAGPRFARRDDFPDLEELYPTDIEGLALTDVDGDVQAGERDWEYI
jgi:hypothetical protein